MTLGFMERWPGGGATNFVALILCGIKIHSFREDPADRWGAGKIIHFVTGNRTPKRRQFRRGECYGKQRLIIRDRRVWIDGREYYDIETLARNDGFPSMDMFWQYFSPGFRGFIIHWTDFKY